MKNLLWSFLGLLSLTLLAAPTYAAPITEWGYKLEGLTFIDANTTLPNYTGNNQSISWTGGMYENTLSTEAPSNSTGNLTLTGDEESGSGSLSPDEALNQTVESTVENSSFGTKPLVTLKFDYTVYSDTLNQWGTPEVLFDISYYIPLYTYYDAANECEYIYYKDNDIMTQGSTAITNDNYMYGITGVGLFVDDREIGTYLDPKTNELYHGWVINNDTMHNMYSQYTPGEDNSKYELGKKEDFGAFDIDGYFSVTYTRNETDATPTPEPTTMMLTGLGLAGLAFARRRRPTAK